MGDSLVADEEVKKPNRQNPTKMRLEIRDRMQIWVVNWHLWQETGMGDLRFSPELSFFWVENIVFSLAIVAYFLTSVFFFSFPVPIPEEN